MDPPVYQCENPQSHSICSSCHQSLQNKEDNTCPVCRKKMLMRRNVTLESMLENNPNKIKCKFDGCDFKRSNGEAVKKHEGDCDNRPVPCGWCDDKIRVKKLAEHITGKHDRKLNFKGLTSKHAFWMLPNAFNKGSQCVLTPTADGNTEEPMFLFNWRILDEGVLMFWISYVGAKASAKKFKYTFQVKVSEHEERYHLESTKKCVPCDLSAEDEKKKMCAVFVDQELVEEAVEGNDGKLKYNLTIKHA